MTQRAQQVDTGSLSEAQLSRLAQGLTGSEVLTSLARCARVSRKAIRSAT